MNDLAMDLKMGVRIAATPERVWESLVLGVGEWFENPDPSKPLQLRLEPWVGGRLYRDLSEQLGDGAGHLWGHVQVFKPAVLLEIVGPWALSDAHLAHITIRLAPAGDGTEVTLSHRAIGHIPEEMASMAEPGWTHVMEGLKSHAER